ncbi:MAG: membrane protein insertion efficiency factor YidD [Candidatus Adiutrix sp.]
MGFLLLLPSQIMLALIILYKRLISPFLPPACRFFPTCSDYGLCAIRTHGFWRGTYLTARRILRCHPFNPGGYDPVPPLRPR